jgi:hypothetical protein
MADEEDELANSDKRKLEQLGADYERDGDVAFARFRDRDFHTYVQIVAGIILEGA